MISLKTNLSAMFVQKQSTKSASALDNAIRRLSSGLQINSARDNAAGQAIANRLTSQQMAMTQAKRNAGDGLSMVENAESALDEINNRLQRIRQLAVQGLNGTNSQSDSDAIQAEINLNLQTIDQLNSSPQFNGINLLDGSAGKLGFQVGANDNEKIELDLSAPGFSVDELGLKDLVISGLHQTVSDTNGYNGSASNISLTSSNVTVSYTAPGLTSPQLVMSNANGRYYLQGNDADGNPAYYLATYSANWDTQTGTGTVSVGKLNNSALYSDVSTLASHTITSLSIVDIDDVAVSDNPTLTQANGQYYIEQDDFYYPASLSFDTSGALTAKMTSTSGLLDTDFSPPPTSVTTTPAINTSTAAMTFSDANGNAVAGRLVQSGSQYMMEVSDGSGNYQYFPASVAAITDGTTSSVSVTATSSTSNNGFTAVTTLPGIAHVTLDPLHVRVDYTDAQGQTFNDVLRLDGDGNYYMDLPGGSASGVKTASLVVQNDLNNPFLLKTLNGVGNVQIYYATMIGSSTDASTNFTVMHVSEVGSEIRLAKPDNPLAAIDQAISKVDARRSQLGAVANRLTSVQNLQSSSVSILSASRSRIEDADYATEVSAMVRTQILQQASTQVLAKANMAPQTILELLKG